jgi:hypothetical protein
VDQVLVRDLTPPGRKLLAELNNKDRYVAEAVEFAAGGEDPPPGAADDTDKSKDVPFVPVDFSNPQPRPLNRAIFEDPQSGSVPLPLSDDRPNHVALSARSIATTGAVIGEPTLTVNRAPTTAIGKAVLSNKAALQLAAFSLRASLDAKLEQMRADRSNSEDPAQYEDLRRRVDEFLIASISNDEPPIVATTLSLADGLRSWWNSDHSSICNRALNMGLFAGGLAICGLAGALGPVSVVTVGTLIGGKDVVSALEVCVKLLKKRD